MRSRVNKVISLLLLLVVILSQFDVSYATAIVDMWYSAGGNITSGASQTTKGVWLPQYQGFRITVVDYAGEPAFTYADKDYLDLVFSYPSDDITYWGLHNKVHAWRGASLKKSDLDAKAFIISIKDFAAALNGGGFAFKSPGTTSITLSNLKNIPYHLTQIGSNWVGQGDQVHKKLYGASTENIDDTAALYAIFNMYDTNNNTYVWKPKDTIECISQQYTPAEKTALQQGKITPFELMASRKLVISVEPIIWNQLRISKSQFSKWSVYGTQTDIGYICDKLIEAGDAFANSDGGGRNGGYDWSLFGKVGRKAMVLTKPIRFHQYKSANGIVKADWTIMPPPDIGDKPVDNTTVKAMQPGWSLFLYQLKPNDASTHTWDEEKYPDPPNFEEHPAPDPTEDPPTKDMVPPGSPLLHFRIVKTYEQEVFTDDTGTTKEIEHVITKTRIPTIPKIQIQHEIEPGGYEVIEWKYGPEYYGGPNGEEVGQDIEAPELPETTPWDTTVKCDEPSTLIEQVPKDPERSGEGEATVDIENKEDPIQIVTLYVRLRKKIKIPETSTFDEPDFPPKGKPPYIPPHGSDDPFQPTPSDPETDHVDEGNRFAHYRIVKLYETIRITADGEQPPEPDGVFTTYKTNPIVYIQDEKQSNDIYDGSWHLEDWDISDDYNPPLPDLWDDLTGTYSAKESGTTEAKVDLRDKDDKEKEVTLYVHLVRRIKEANPTGAIIIQQSQISKAIRTNDAVIGGKFGNYRFAMTVGDYAETHTSYYHDYCCRSSETHDCGHCHGHTCKMNMPGNWGDDKVNFNFDLTSSQDELEIKKGVNQNTNPQVYGHSGGAVDALDPGQNYPETVPSLKASANKYYYTSNGKDAKGAEYVTILWRGTSKDNYKDIPTLAKFKESDVKLTFGSADNYNIPKDMLASAGSQPNRKTNQKRASTYLVTDLEFQFGVHGRSDLEATSSCSNVGSFKGGCVHTETQSYYPIEGTEFKYDFKAGVAIRFYAGKSKSLQAMPFGSKTSTPILENKTGNHKELNVIQCKQQINFYPYIRMTYMVNSLDDATKEAQNTDTNGYKQDVRYDTYILSEYESQVLPSDAVRVEWQKGGADENLLLTSQQWSVHQKAVNGGQVWNGKNQVLPGGAIYQLSTPKGDWVKMGLTTYQTVIDQKARNEYLTASNTLSGDEYTEAKVAKDHLDFINDAKEVLDNLKVVQWVNRNAGASKTWTDNFKPDPQNGIIKILDGLEISSIDLSKLRDGSKTHPNDDEKYYMRQQTQFSNYQSSKLSEWTKTIDESQGIKEQSYEGDLDIFNFEHTTTVFKLFTDTSGNVYLAQMEKKYPANDKGVDSNEQDIKSMVQSMQELDYDTYAKGQTGGATVTKLCDKKVPGSGINGRLSGDAKDIDDATKFITNFVSSLTRNKGSDYTAEWSSGQKDGTWYNEAFDGAYLVRQKAVFNVGFAFSSTRTSALDPALCPQNKGQSDLYTKAFLSQFCTDSQSDAAVAQGKKQNYLGTFKDTDITLPDMESLYISKKFYIPNANVQDLN